MRQRVSIAEARNNLSKLVRTVERGEPMRARAACFGGIEIGICHDPRADAP
jgi:hypothetical protein